MRKRLTKFAQVAGIMLALALIFSCSSDKDDDNSGGGSGDKGNDIKNYKTVKIGDQVWMAENLNYRGTEPDTLGVCYGNYPANCKKYGRLYSLATAMTVCPSGWHLPSQAEWNTLMTTVGGGSTAGTKLKSKSGWNDYQGKSGNGTNDYGFSALPGGRGSSSGAFNYMGERGYWWSSGSGITGETYANAYYLYYDRESVQTQSESMSGGFPASVRCVQD